MEAGLLVIVTLKIKSYRRHQLVLATKPILMIDKIYLHVRCESDSYSYLDPFDLLVMGVYMGVASLLGVLGLRFADERCLFPRMHAHACACVHGPDPGLLAVADAHAHADATEIATVVTCS